LDVVSEISKHLKQESIDVYVAEFYPEPGEMLPKKILKNLRSSDCMVVILTSVGVQSPWVQQEIGVAKTLDLPIIPMVEEGVTVKGLLEGVEYIPLDRRKLDVAIDTLVKAVKKIRELRVTYTTGQAAKLLGIGFATLKRWIYSGKIRVTKTSSGRYLISRMEIQRLKSVLEAKKTDQFSRDIIDLVVSKKVAYLRELQVCLEDIYLQSDTYHQLESLVPKRLQSEFQFNNRWYFPSNLRWKDVEHIAKHKSNLIDVYTKHPRRYERRGITYMDYSEFLVEGAMIQAGYTIVAKDTYYFNGIVYLQNAGPGRPRDLDFIACIPGKRAYIGVQVKNRMGYPKRDDISEFLDICNTLHLKPVLVTRMAHPAVFTPIRSMGVV
jgi:excisionase family DNA binding protein